MGLLDFLQNGGDQSGLLDFLRNNAQNQNLQQGIGADTATYAPGPAPLSFAPQMQQPQQQPQVPQVPMPVPDPRKASPANVPAPGGGPAASPAAGGVPAPLSLAPAQPPPASGPPSSGPGLLDRLQAGLGSISGSKGLFPSLLNGMQGFAAGQRVDPQALQQTATVQALRAKGVSDDAIRAGLGNPEIMKQLVTQLGPQSVDNLGDGYIRDRSTGKVTRAYTPEKSPTSIGEGYIIQNGKVLRAYTPEDKTPNSVAEYKYYVENLPKGQQPMDYATFSTSKARAGATNISNSVDLNSGQTYDKQLAEGLGKSHSALATGVEDAQARARDIAAMQGAVDAIQKAGGTTGGLAPAQRLELLKTINAGASALGIEKPFDEKDISDKEFLTKFNRSMAGAQAKNAVGARVTNFEMSNFLKANPGLEMSVTGNQRLLGIQAQMEQRNIDVGNAIRAATAQAISKSQKIDPVTVQKIITDYDEQHHIMDPVNGQDLTQSYVLPEFQAQGNNPALSATHEGNVSKMRVWTPGQGVR